MPVIGENLGQPFLAHRLHRNTIDQAVALVGAGAVKVEASAKRFPALRNHPHRGTRQQPFDAFGGVAVDGVSEEQSGSYW